MNILQVLLFYLIILHDTITISEGRRTRKRTYRTQYYLNKGSVSIPKNNSLVLATVPVNLRNFLTNEHCSFNNSGCYFRFQETPDPSDSNLKTVNYHIEISRARPFMCGKMELCDLDMRGLVNVDTVPYRCFKRSKVISTPQIINEGLDVTITGWHMDRTHYENLSKKDYIVFNVPAHKPVRIFFSVSFMGQSVCMFSSGYSRLRGYHSYQRTTGFKRFRQYTLSIPRAGGASWSRFYQFRCTTEFDLPFEGIKKRVTIRKSLKLKTITKEPIITIISGKSPFVFPANIKKGAIEVSIFSSRDITKVILTARGSAADVEGSLVTHLYDYGYYRHYEVAFLRPTIAIDGEYEVIVSTKNSATIARVNFKVMISSMPNINVVPSRIETTVGRNVSLDCIATGTHLKHMRWKRDGNIKMGVNTNVTDLSGKNNDKIIARRLSIGPVTYEDSGWYYCTAGSTHEDHYTRKGTLLIVHQPEAESESTLTNFLNIWKKKPDIEVKLDGEESRLNVTDNHLYKEWRRAELRSIVRSLSTFHYIAAGVTSLCVCSSVVALMTVIIFLACCISDQTTTLNDDSKGVFFKNISSARRDTQISMDDGQSSDSDSFYDAE